MFLLNLKVKTLKQYGVIPIHLVITKYNHLTDPWVINKAVPYTRVSRLISIVLYGLSEIVMTNIVTTRTGILIHIREVSKIFHCLRTPG